LFLTPEKYDICISIDVVNGAVIGKKSLEITSLILVQNLLFLGTGVLSI
jgi:hypothetical protein